MNKTDCQRSGGNLFADLGLDRPDERLAKAVLAANVARRIAQRRLTQTAAAKVLGVDQPKVSALLRGKLARFSSDRLIRFLTLLGNDVDIAVRPRRSTRPGHLYVVAA